MSKRMDDAEQEVPAEQEFRSMDYLRELDGWRADQKEEVVPIYERADIRPGQLAKLRRRIVELENRVKELEDRLEQPQTNQEGDQWGMKIAAKPEG